MGAEELDSPDSGSRRRRRRRRRRRGAGENGEGDGALHGAMHNGGEERHGNAHAGGHHGGGHERAERAERGDRPGRGAAAWREDNQPVVRLPPTGNVPSPQPAYHPARTEVSSSTSRRRRLSRVEMDDLVAYLERMPDAMVSALYKGMGGQPGRVASKDRMIQLAVRAIAQGTRLGSLIRSLHQRDRQALAILVQCGGIAHHEELYQELTLSLGGNEREWQKVLATLGERGLVAASEQREDAYFYLIPEPLVSHLVEHLHDDLALPSFDHEDVRVIDPQAFSPPLEFSIVTLATYIDQHPPRLTQRQEIFKGHKDEMDRFFGQLWAPDSDLFSFHIEFLMVHGMVELKGDRLSLNRAVLEEWLQLDSPDQRDLIFSALEKRFPNAEWVMWAINDLHGDWVPERPLQALYRRWRRGEDWRKRFHTDDWSTQKRGQRDNYTFTPLITTGLVEMGQWGQEKFYRLSPRGARLLRPPDEDSFSQFFLTPSFEIMAPAGASPLLFFRIGELAELTACDRANTYKINQVSIEHALEKGWRRDDVLEFLRDNSQIGLPENVEQTLRGWMGHHGDVEFHDVMLLTVHRSQIKRIEGLRKLKPFLLHRFVPGMYAVDRTRIAELNAALQEADFSPMKAPREYPGDPQSVDSRRRLLALVNEARQEREDLVGLAQSADTQPENLHPIPGTAKPARKARRKRDELPPRRSPREVRDVIEKALAEALNLQMLYVTRTEERKLVTVLPERLATNPQGQQVLVARDLEQQQRLSYQVLQIERIDTVPRK